MEKKKIVITGANGFLGSNIARIAKNSGWDVLGLVRRPEACKVVEKTGVKCHCLENYDCETLESEFQGYSAVLHLIGITGGSKEQFQKINVDLTANIIEAARNAKVKKILYPSGLGVSEYGKKDWATNNYFWSKKEIEKMFSESDINYTLFRPSYIIGPGDELLPYLTHEITEGKVNVVGEGTTPIQPIYVEDVAKIFLAAALGKGKSRAIYDLVGPSLINMNFLVDMAADALSKMVDRIIVYTKNHIPPKDAPEVLGFSKEDVDVSQCDTIGDNSFILHDFEISLTPLAKAVKKTVRHSLENPMVKKYG